MINRDQVVVATPTRGCISLNRRFLDVVGGKEIQVTLAAVVKTGLNVHSSLETNVLDAGS